MKLKDKEYFEAHSHSNQVIHVNFYPIPKLIDSMLFHSNFLNQSLNQKT